MKTMIKPILCLLIFVSFTAQANAFVFSDLAAFGQRLAEFLKNAKNWTETSTHYQQVVDYAKDINQFKNQFDTYWKTYNRIYSRVSSGQYTNAFDVTKWDWTKLDDHILRTWRSYNRAFWDAQQLALMSSQLVQSNPAYMAYATRVSQMMDERAQKLQQNEAMLRDIEEQNRNGRETLDSLRKKNMDLTVTTGSSDDPMDVAQLQSLNNLIMLEQSAIQAREAAIVTLERRQTEEMKALGDELKALETELRQNAFNEGWGFILNFSEQERR
jgi:hypothetical protein